MSRMPADVLERYSPPMIESRQLSPRLNLTSVICDLPLWRHIYMTSRCHNSPALMADVATMTTAVYAKATAQWANVGPRAHQPSARSPGSFWSRCRRADAFCLLILPQPPDGGGAPLRRRELKTLSERGLYQGPTSLAMRSPPPLDPVSVCPIYSFVRPRGGKGSLDHF